VVISSTSRTGRLYPQEMFLVLIFTRGWVDRGTVGRKMSLKNLVTPPGIDPGTVWRVAQRIYTGSPSRNLPDFGRVFLMLKYSDVTQNTYVQSWTVTEIMAREKCGLLAGPRTVPGSWQFYPCPSLSVVSYYGNSAYARNKLFIYFLLGDKALHVSAWHSCNV